MINIKNYNTEQEYQAETRSEQESVVSHIDAGNQVKYDGVNVEVSVPKAGDAVYHDGSHVHFYDGNTLNHALLAAQGLIPVGACCGLLGDKAVIVDGEEADRIYADVVQFSISAISATSITFYLKMAGDYASFVQIDVSLTSAEINATSASEINAALESAGNTGNVGYDKHKYWAYLADADGNKVDADGTQIIVQCDQWYDYRQYQCSDSTHALVGCTMILSVWGDMPASSTNGFRVNGISGNEHIMNVAKGSAYYSTNGRTPTEDVPLNAAAGIVKKTDFETSSYCVLLRQTYGTYENYIRKEYTLMYPQKLGVFSMPRAQELSTKYAMLTAPIKDGTVKFKFPALNYAASKGYAANGITVGNWFLSGVQEGTMFMKDEIMSSVNATLTKIGKTVIRYTSTRWFAQRYNANCAWYFSGGSGGLSYLSYVNYTLRSRAVSLYSLNK